VMSAVVEDVWAQRFARLEAFQEGIAQLSVPETVSARHERQNIRVDASVEAWADRVCLVHPEATSTSSSSLQQAGGSYSSAQRRGASNERTAPAAAKVSRDYRVAASPSSPWKTDSPPAVPTVPSPRPPLVSDSSASTAPIPRWPSARRYSSYEGATPPSRPTTPQASIHSLSDRFSMDSSRQPGTSQASAGIPPRPGTSKPRSTAAHASGRCDTGVRSLVAEADTNGPSFLVCGRAVHSSVDGLDGGCSVESTRSAVSAAPARPLSAQQQHVRAQRSPNMASQRRASNPPQPKGHFNPSMRRASSYGASKKPVVNAWATESTASCSNATVASQRSPESTPHDAGSSSSTSRPPCTPLDPALSEFLQRNKLDSLEPVLRSNGLLTLSILVATPDVDIRRLPLPRAFIPILLRGLRAERMQCARAWEDACTPQAARTSSAGSMKVSSAAQASSISAAGVDIDEGFLSCQASSGSVYQPDVSTNLASALSGWRTGSGDLTCEESQQSLLFQGLAVEEGNAPLTTLASKRQLRIQELLQHFDCSPCPMEKARVKSRQVHACQQHLQNQITSNTIGAGSPTEIESEMSDTIQSNSSVTPPVRRHSRSLMDLVSSSSGPPPSADPLEAALVARVLSNLPLVKAGDQHREPCSICLEVPEQGERLTTLPCYHLFHTECIREWLLHSRLCPLCKTSAVPTRTSVHSS